MSTVNFGVLYLKENKAGKQKYLYQKRGDDMFSDEEKQLMIKIGICVDFGSLSDDEFVMIEEIVSKHLQRNGFDAEYKPTREGLVCEAILDKLP